MPKLTKAIWEMKFKCQRCGKYFLPFKMYDNKICLQCAEDIPVEWTCSKCGKSYLDTLNAIPENTICINCQRNEVSEEAGGVKYDNGKLRFDLIPPESLKAIAEVFTFGAKKYGDRNWEKGISANRHFGAVQRHLWQWWQGKELDEESGLSHLSHAICDLAMLLATVQRRPDLDNRPSKGEREEHKNV
jgi:hypothetical protein